MLDAYRKARSKLDKSKVLSDVVEQVRQNSPRGGFVKQDSHGRWHEVGDFLAREKTSQAFRDALHENYKSSNVSKKKRRQQEAPRADKPRKLSCDGDIERRMEKLSFGFGKARKSPAHAWYHKCYLMESVKQESSYLFVICTHSAERPTGELREDYERPRSFSASPSAAFRLSSTNNEAVTELSMSRLGGVRKGFEPFRLGHESSGFHSRDRVSSRARRGYHRHRRPHSYSVPSSPSNVPLSFDNAPPDLYHSSPDMNFSFDEQSEPTIDEMESMHHSAPDLFYEPSPREFNHFAYETSVSHQSSKSSAEAPAERDDEPVTISSSLIESLARLTSAENDDNPFEPIPLSPASQARPSLAMTGKEFLNINERPLPDFEEED